MKDKLEPVYRTVSLNQPVTNLGNREPLKVLNGTKITTETQFGIIQNLPRSPILHTSA